ncbi:MAG: prohibitin family protein [Bacteroidota bacterium]
MNKKFRAPLIILVIIVILLLIFGSRMFYTLRPGERAVIFKTFAGGLNKDNVLSQGFHIIAPWNELIIYNVLEQKAEEKMDILDKSGLSMNVDVTILFNPIFDKVGYLHQNIGVGYIDVKVIPVIRSSVREIMGRYTAEEIYSTKRQEVEAAIAEKASIILRENNIEMKSLLIRSIILPTEIKSAIENKLKQEQEALAYKFRLEKETSEAERKRIAAEGEARANNIVNSSLSDKLLQMRGIEATLELSKSPNSKIVVIGGGDKGLPLILNN